MQSVTAGVIYLLLIHPSILSMSLSCIVSFISSVKLWVGRTAHISGRRNISHIICICVHMLKIVSLSLSISLHLLKWDFFFLKACCVYFFFVRTVFEHNARHKLQPTCCHEIFRTTSRDQRCQTAPTMVNGTPIPSIHCAQTSFLLCGHSNRGLLGSRVCQPQLPSPPTPPTHPPPRFLLELQNQAGVWERLSQKK